jgi:cytochrome P450
LDLTERVIRETLRLRPVSWGIFRETQVGSRLGDERVGRFDPDLLRNCDSNEMPAYFPFGAGSQSCIGGWLAMTEATHVLLRVCSEFDPKTTTRAIDDLWPATALQPGPFSGHRVRDGR